MPSFEAFHDIAPNIDVRLFGEAAETGAKLGQAIPNPITSVIEGGLQGYQQGLQFQREQEQNQAIQQENEIRQLTLDNDKELNDLQKQATEAKLHQQIDSYTQSQDDLKTQNAISQKVSSRKPEDIASIYGDPTLRKYLLDNPKFADQVAGAAISTPGISDDIKQQALGSLALSQQLNFRKQYDAIQAHQDLATAKEYDQAQKAFDNVPVIKAAVQGIPESQLPSRVKTIPSGSGVYNADGSLNTSVPLDLKAANDPHKFDLLIDGKKVGSVSNTEAASYLKYRDTIAATQRTLARQSGIYHDAWTFPGTTPQSSTPQTQPSGSPNVPTLNQPEAPASTRTPGPNENPDIVTQSQADFNKVMQAPPPGMTGAAILQRRQNALQITNKVADKTPSKVLNQATSVNQASALQIQVETPPTQSQQIGVGRSLLPPTTLEPNQIMRGVFGTNVSYTVPTPPKFSPKEDVLNRINTDPLTKDEPPLIKGVIAQESGGKRDAESPTGVRGLMQVTKSTAESFGLNRDIPEQGVLAGKLYLAQLAHRFGGNLPLTLAAYNVGPGVISEAIKETGSTDWADIKGYLKDNLSAKKFKEVEYYPEKIINYSTQFMNQGGQGTQALGYLYERNGFVSQTPNPSTQTFES